MSLRVLIRLPHGLGDVVQYSVILKHLAKYRPGWKVDTVVGRGKHTALIGLCHRVYHDQEEEPKGPYNSSLALGWYENFNRYPDRPNSKITACLAEVFGIPYDPDLGRYHVTISQDAKDRARAYLEAIGARPRGNVFGAVVIHYQGNTSPTKKNLGHWQAKALCDLAVRAGRVPIILDWDQRSSLPDGKRIFCPNIGGADIWGNFGSGDASVIGALISQAEAFVGIDSGPGKVASATETPSLVCWLKHHPIQFHDPAPNTVHLVPAGHRKLPPCDGAPAVWQYFEKHYNFLTYEGDHGLVEQACRWLAHVLHCPKQGEPPIQFVVPNGIGDTMWALLKIRGIADGRPIDVILSGDPKKEIDKRTVPFLKRFPFVREISVLDVPVIHDRENPANSRGRYHYVADGERGTHHFLVPNATLEDGRRIEDWMPNFPIDWNVINEFDWHNTERGDGLGRALSPFVAFYLGPEAGHASEGHNRNWLWEPRHWIELGQAMKDRGLKVVLVGAKYDRSFWERYVKTGVEQAGQQWTDLIGQMEIGETFAFLKHARAFVSYQCGLGIVLHYMGGKVAMWWRPAGDSIHPKHHISFSEQMAHCWTNPALQDNYIPLIYKRESVEDIVAEMEKRGWL